MNISLLLPPLRAIEETSRAGYGILRNANETTTREAPPPVQIRNPHARRINRFHVCLLRFIKIL